MIDAAAQGHKALYLPRGQLLRILGPLTTKSKIAEIRKGEVTLEDVFPTTFNAISQWLNGKAILHTIPASMKSKELKELVHLYVLAARLGHRAIVHDCVNNMPLTDTPYEFLETCALIYKSGCVGVAFRNFFRKGLPVILEDSPFDQTERVVTLMQESPELATDFAETMLGVMRQAQEPAPAPGNVHRTHTEPFPSFSRFTPHRDPDEEMCSCGLHDCTCTFETASIVRPFDSQNIPRRSGYVETAPPSEASDAGWAGPGMWHPHDGTAGWNYSHHPGPTASNIPGPPLSFHDAEDRPPVRPRDWSSAHIGHTSRWEDVGGDEGSLISGWDNDAYAEARNWASASNPWPRGSPEARPGSRALVPAGDIAQHARDLEARLHNIEQQLQKANISSGATPKVSAANAKADEKTAHPRRSASAAGARTSTPLASSNMPPDPLLHPGVPPAAMPNYVPGYGYNRYVQIGNGVVHPTGPGPYGLAGRSMVAVRNSNPFDCTLTFTTGDIIECVVPCEEGRSTAQHQPWNFAGHRMQGICRTQAGSFPADYVREMSGDVVSTRPPTVGVPSASNIPQMPVPPAGPKVAGPINPRQGTAPITPGATQTSKNTTAANVDVDWLNVAHTANMPPPQYPPGATAAARPRRSSTSATATRNQVHLPGCPSQMAKWASCNCPAASVGNEQQK